MKMAECILFNIGRDLCMESRNVKKNRVISPQMNDQSELYDIANLFAGKYNNM